MLKDVDGGAEKAMNLINMDYVKDNWFRIPVNVIN